MQIDVNLIDLFKSFPTSILFANIGFDTAENEPFNFHNFSSLQGFNFHRAVVSAEVVDIHGRTARELALHAGQTEVARRMPRHAEERIHLRRASL